eukprot:COSAG02_NODE_68701_length_228_cov_40.217054_1_plen_76_part_11
MSSPDHVAESRCALLGLVSCGGGDDSICATHCPEGADRGCRGGVCARTMTVTAVPVPSPAEVSCAMVGMVLCGVVD